MEEGHAIHVDVEMHKVRLRIEECTFHVHDEEGDERLKRLEPVQYTGWAVYIRLPWNTGALTVLRTAFSINERIGLNGLRVSGNREVH